MQSPHNRLTSRLLAGLSLATLVLSGCAGAAPARSVETPLASQPASAAAAPAAPAANVFVAAAAAVAGPAAPAAAADLIPPFPPRDPAGSPAATGAPAAPLDPPAAALKAIRDDLAAGRSDAARDAATAADPALGGHAARLYAEWAQATGKYHEAIASYRRAIDAGMSRSHQVNVLERLGQSSAAIGDWPAAAVYYRQSGALARTYGYKAEATYREAEALAKSGDAAAARDLWAKTAKTYPDAAFGAKALEALGSAAFDLVPAATRAQIYAARGQFGPAAEAYTKAARAAASPDDAYDHLFDRAVVRYRDDDAAAVEDFREILRNYPAHGRADDALWYLAQAALEASQTETARAQLDTLADQYPNSPYADDALVETGILAWRAGDVAAAQQAWSRISAGYLQGDNASRALYWLGKVKAQVSGDAAGQADLQAAARYDDYYGYRARAALRGEWRPPRDSLVPAALTSPLRSADRDAETLKWLASWSKVAGTTLDLPANVISGDGFRRAQALRDAGLPSDAGVEIADLAATLTERPADLFRLAVWLSDQGQTTQAMNLAYQVDDLATRAGVATRPAALSRLIYPNAFADLIVKSAPGRGVDPVWFLSLIRQESSFNPTIQSPAGARGLAQIMPATGEMIAQGFGWTDFTVADLDRPAVAVELGTAYVANSLGQFGGDMMLSLAGYNAGNGAVTKWLKGAKTYSDYDLFVESIPYRETRTYVKKIYVNYYRYRAIYGG